MGGGGCLGGRGRGVSGRSGGRRLVATRPKRRESGEGGGVMAPI